MLTENELETLVQYSQIISPILAFLAIIVSWFIYVNQKKKDRKEKAIQIGSEIENVVVLIAYINMVLELEAPNLIPILHHADKKKMKEFKRVEIRDVYTREELQEIKKHFTNNIYSYYAVGASPQIFKVSTKNLLLARKRFANLFNESIVGMDKNSLDDFLSFEFQQMITKTFNRLETLCMMMIKKLADEKTVYNSTEDIFLEFIARFYYYIATINANLAGADKKLKNVIKIFNRWVRKSERERKLR